jgi:SAM-dependent methyltransferase
MTAENYASGSLEGQQDAIYYRDGVTNPLAEWLMGVARRHMYRLFCKEMAVTPGTSILDIGVSAVETLESNVLERLYPHRHMITCAGLSDGVSIRQHYPEVSYVQIAAGKRLPFEDKQFDVAHSNAVLEHVGGPQERASFLREALRVANSLFFTVPNRWFPVEHHSGILLLHYSPALFRRLLKHGKKSYWADQSNLDFLDKSTLRREFKEAAHLRLKNCGLRLGPFASNIALVIKPSKMGPSSGYISPRVRDR